MQKKIERDFFIDFIKGILMFSVIRGHFFSYTSCGNSDILGNYPAYLMLFQMPLFMLVSGYFQKGSLNISNYFTKIKKSFYRLICPLITWTIICDIILCINKDLTISDWIKTSYIYWYILCLFPTLLLFNTITLLSIKCHIKPFFLFIAICTTTLFIKYPFNVGFMFPFFIAGYYMHKYKGVMEQFEKTLYFKMLFFIALLFIIFFGGNFVFEKTFYCVDNRIINEPAKLYFVFYRYIANMTACFIVFYTIKLIYNHIKSLKITQFVCKLGKDSLYLYLAHITILFYIYKPIIENLTYGTGILTSYPALIQYAFNIIFSIIIVFLLFLLERLFKHNILCKELFLGLK